jgi:hypothetical protein
MAIPDPLGALRTIVGLDAAITAATGGRIYVGELPPAEAALQPRAAILLQPAGGLPELGMAKLSWPRIDARVYGTTPNEAWRLALQLHELLKGITRDVAVASSSGDRALIHRCTPAGGPNLLRDADGKWPMVLRSYELMVSETPIP